MWQWIRLPHLPAAWAVLDRGEQREEFWRQLRLLHACERRRACRRCQSCRRVIADALPTHFTLRVPRGKKEVPLAAVRVLKSSLKLFSREPRLVGILHAERLSLPAQEALLKIVEEPPAGVRFVFMVSDFANLSPPLLSRCLRFALLPPAPAGRLHRIVRGQLSAEQRRRLLELPLMLRKGGAAHGIRLASELGRRVERMDLLLEIWQDYLRSLLERGGNSAAARALVRVVWARRAVREKWPARDVAVYLCLAPAATC